MASRQKKTQSPAPGTILRLLDLEQSKNAVLHSLAASREFPIILSSRDGSVRHVVLCWFRVKWRAAVSC